MCNKNVWDMKDTCPKEGVYVINNVESVLSAEKSEIEKHNIIVQALTEKLIKTIKQNVNYIHFPEETMDAAFRYDSEKHDAMSNEKVFYDYFEDLILSTFFNNSSDAKLTEIVRHGYEGYSYSFYVDYKKIKFCIEIPCLSYLDSDNFEVMMRGKISVSYQSKHDTTYTIFVKSYNEKEIVVKIKEFLEKRQNC